MGNPFDICKVSEAFGFVLLLEFVGIPIYQEKYITFFVIGTIAVYKLTGENLHIVQLIMKNSAKHKDSEDRNTYSTRL